MRDPEHEIAQTERPEFLQEQLVTCIGNKRALLDFIGLGVQRVITALGRKRISIFDVFSGSGVVSRYFKRFASRLVSNDLERYARIMADCYLANQEELDLPALGEMHREILVKCASGGKKSGFISELYAPADDRNIKPGERVFYTTRNAGFIDAARQGIQTLPEKCRRFFIAPLISEASVHANTAGVFKGFYKDSSTGIGQFGGNAKDALSRIMADITLPFPVWSRFSSDVTVLQKDALDAADCVPEVDLAYLDPPYNQHPYGSNYFMLNLIADYQRPARTSRVSGIPGDWQRSAYNRRQDVASELGNLVRKIKAAYLLVSYNSEGYVSFEEMHKLLSAAGSVEVLSTQYNAFRGSRNLHGRSIHVHENLFLVKTR